MKFSRQSDQHGTNTVVVTFFLRAKSLKRNFSIRTSDSLSNEYKSLPLLVLNKFIAYCVRFIGSKSTVCLD